MVAVPAVGVARSRIIRSVVVLPAVRPEEAGHPTRSHDERQFPHRGDIPVPLGQAGHHDLPVEQPARRI
jgi:hypothetical protein